MLGTKLLLTPPIPVGQDGIWNLRNGETVKQEKRGTAREAATATECHFGGFEKSTFEWKQTANGRLTTHERKKAEMTTLENLGRFAFSSALLRRARCFFRG